MSLPSALPDLYNTLHTRAPRGAHVTSRVASRAFRRGAPSAPTGGGPRLSEADREITARGYRRETQPLDAQLAASAWGRLAGEAPQALRHDAHSAGRRRAHRGAVIANATDDLRNTIQVVAWPPLPRRLSPTSQPSLPGGDGASSWKPDAHWCCKNDRHPPLLPTG